MEPLARGEVDAEGAVQDDGGRGQVEAGQRLGRRPQAPARRHQQRDAPPVELVDGTSAVVDVVVEVPQRAVEVGHDELDQLAQAGVTPRRAAAAETPWPATAAASTEATAVGRSRSSSRAARTSSSAASPVPADRHADRRSAPRHAESSHSHDVR